MKALVCEICGGNDLVKQDGVFVCQSCGCKYSVEEARNMMVEGTVEVQSPVKSDGNKELDNLKTLARRAKDSGNTVEAEKYYSKVLTISPNDWEAVFYSLYYQSLNIKIIEIANASEILKNSLPSIFDSISLTADIDAKKNAIEEIVIKIVALCENYYYASLKHFKESFDRMIKTNSDIAFNYLEQHIEKVKSILSIPLFLNDELEKYDGDKSFTETLSRCFLLNNEAYIRLFINTPTFLDKDDILLWKLLLQTAVSKIEKYNEAYLLPKPTFDGYPSDIRTIMKNHINESGYLEHCNEYNKKIEKRIAEKQAREKRERIEKYWETRPEEKEKLEKELAEIQNQIDELDSQIRTAEETINELMEKKFAELHSEIEVKKQNEIVLKLEQKIKTLGFFKGKEKKMIKEQLENIEIPKLEELKKFAEEEKEKHQQAFDEKIALVKKQTKELELKKGEIIERRINIKNELEQDR